MFDLWKKLFSDIPKKLLFIEFSTIFVWSLFNCFFIEMLSNFTTKVVKGDGDIVITAIFYLLFCFLWCLTEYIGDVYDDLCYASIENNTNFSNYVKAYRTKPEVLKKANTGYIANVIKLNKILYKYTKRLT